MRFVCPSCHHPLPAPSRSSDLLVCNCGQRYETREGIPLFCAPGYWNNVPRETMAAALDDAAESGDWKGAMERHLPRYVRAAAPAYRADAQFLFPVNRQSTVLDAGAMWGALTVPMSRFCSAVYAIDRTLETLQLLTLRARQGGLTNIVPAVADVTMLPFADAFFDCVILNGVLEWVANDDEIVVETDLEGRRSQRKNYRDTPRERQLRALKEIRRVTKPEGSLYLAIENRAGLQYKLGWPDDHVNLRWVTFLPRTVANTWTKLRRNCEYRTWIYSPEELQQIMTEAGFRSFRTYAVQPHYGRISAAVPREVFDGARKLAMRTDSDYRAKAFCLAWAMTPRGKTFGLSPSIATIASAGASVHPSRLVCVLSEAGALQGPPGDHEPLLINARYGDLNSVNFVIWSKKTSSPILFCKVARMPGTGALEHEAAMIRHASERAQQAGIALETTLPSVVFQGTIDGVSVLAEKYIEHSSLHDGIWAHLRRLDKIVPDGNTFVGATRDSITMTAGRFWLKVADSWLDDAIGLLARFHSATRTRTVATPEEWGWMLKSILAGLDRNRMLTPSVEDRAGQVFEAISGCAVHVAMVHGDFDVVNLARTATGVTLIDFEDASLEGLPFVDLGNLILNPLLVQWSHASQRQMVTTYARKSGWAEWVGKWVDRYGKMTGTPSLVLRHFPALAALQQNAYQFPAWRDARTYPMFGPDVLDELLSWTIS